mgnify:CR=1 FL=1|tara:strand:- start:187 stop:660 length:474 start_codon:yes stop_codon:yes gene_type:complete
MTSKFTITSNSFKDGEVIKNIYACPENRQPHFAWKGHPNNTKCFAIIMDDADAIAVVGHIFVHWNVFNIPSTITSINEGQKIIEGSTIGVNHFKRKDYSGPCPPKGTPHTYNTSIYALNRSLENIDTETPWSRMKFENLFKPDILNVAGIIGIYSSP